MAQSKPHNEYLPGYKPSQVSHHEWRTVENSAAYLLPTLRALHASNPSLSFLDVGAGSGTISAGFAQLLQPSGHVTATDLSDTILARAKGFASTANMSFQQANVYSLPFADNTFDVAHCHQMLCHLDAPADALREMLRVTKPGGVVAARESDLRSQAVWPEIPAVARWHELHEKITTEAGVCWTGGRQLVAWALKAGARREKITFGYGTWCFNTPEDKKMWSTAMVERIRHGEMRKKGVELGLITSDEQVEEVAAAWQDWAERDDASLGMMHGEIIIRK